jgi:hypothetical membrane protein
VSAPILLIGGWTIAAARQPGDFSSTARTISDLAALDAADRWVMTVAIGATGACHVVTALGLRRADRRGRVLLGLGGVSTVLVALFALPSAGASSQLHTMSALAAFVLLTVWAPAAGGSGDTVPWGLRRPVAAGAGVVLGALTLWFFVAALVGAADVGLAERLTAAAQALWPAAVVASVPRRR